MIDNEGQKKLINLKPGEMILYESAKVPHGRQFPLQGEYYDNLLVHFHLMDKKLDENANWYATGSSKDSSDAKSSRLNILTTGGFGTLL